MINLFEDPVTSKTDFNYRCIVVSALKKQQPIAESIKTVYTWDDNNAESLPNIKSVVAERWFSKLEKLPVFNCSNNNISLKYHLCECKSNRFLVCPQNSHVLTDLLEQGIFLTSEKADNIWDDLSFVLYGTKKYSDHLFLSSAKLILCSDTFIRSEEELLLWADDESPLLVMSLLGALAKLIGLDSALFYRSVEEQQDDDDETGKWTNICYVTRFLLDDDKPIISDNQILFGIFKERVLLCFKNTTSSDYSSLISDVISIQNGFSDSERSFLDPLEEGTTFEAKLNLIQNHYYIQSCHQTINYSGCFERPSMAKVPVVPIDISAHSIQDAIEANYSTISQYGAIKLIYAKRNLAPYRVNYSRVSIPFKTQTVAENQILTSPSAKHLTIDAAKSQSIRHIRTLHNFARPFSQLYSSTVSYLVYESDLNPLLSHWDLEQHLYNSELNYLTQVDLINEKRYRISVGDSFIGLTCQENNLMTLHTVLSGNGVFWIIIPKRYYIEYRRWMKENNYYTADDGKILMDPKTLPPHFELSFVYQQVGEILVVDNCSVFMGFTTNFSVCMTQRFVNPAWVHFHHLEAPKNKIPPHVFISLIQQLRKIKMDVNVLEYFSSKRNFIVSIIDNFKVIEFDHNKNISFYPEDDDDDNHEQAFDELQLIFSMNLTCSKCDYKAPTALALRTHRSRKHNKVMCRWCHEYIEGRQEHKKHEATCNKGRHNNNKKTKKNK